MIDDSAKNDNIFDIRIYGVKYQTYSKSYLCWGSNEFKRLYESQIIRVKSSSLLILLLLIIINFKAQNFSTNVSSPCFPKNWIETSYSTFDSACTSTDELMDKVNQNYKNHTRSYI